MARSRRGGGGTGGFRSRGVGVSSSRPAAASRSRSASTSAAPPKKPAAAPAPTQASSVPAPTQQPSSGGGMMSGIGSTIAQGMAFGTGSAIAHRAVGSVAGMFGGGGGDGDAEQPQIQENQQAAAPQMINQQPDVCAYDKQAFYDCLNENKGDQETCNFLYEQLKQCQQNQMQFS